jgi:hypothetical protein
MSVPLAPPVSASVLCSLGIAPLHVPVPSLNVTLFLSMYDRYPSALCTPSARLSGVHHHISPAVSSCQFRRFPGNFLPRPSIGVVHIIHPCQGYLERSFSSYAPPHRHTRSSPRL